MVLGLSLTRFTKLGYLLTPTVPPFLTYKVGIIRIFASKGINNLMSNRCKVLGTVPRPDEAFTRYR